MLHEGGSARRVRGAGAQLSGVHDACWRGAFVANALLCARDSFASPLWVPSVRSRALQLRRALTVADHFNAKRRKQVEEAQQSIQQASAGSFAALSIPQVRAAPRIGLIQQLDALSKDPPPAKKEGGDDAKPKDGGGAKSGDAPKAGADGGDDE